MRKEESVSFSNRHDPSAWALFLISILEQLLWNTLHGQLQTSRVSQPVLSVFTSLAVFSSPFQQSCSSVLGSSLGLVAQRWRCAVERFVLNGLLTDNRLKLRYTPFRFTFKAVLLRSDFPF